MRLLISVCPDVNQHFVPGIEAPPISGTAFPLTAVPRILFRLDVVVVDVVHQVLQRVEQQVALHPAAGQLTFQRRLGGKLLFSVLSDEHGGGEAVASGWASHGQIKRKTGRTGSAVNTMMMRWLP